MMTIDRNLQKVSGLTLAACVSLMACAGPDMTEVEDPAIIEVERSAVALSAMEKTLDPPPVQVILSNAGKGALKGLSTSVAYSGTESGWLSATVDSAAETRVTLAAAIDGLAPGTHRASVTVSATSAVEKPVIEVTLELEEAPRIQLSRASASWSIVSGRSTWPLTVEVANQGGGHIADLAASISYDAGGPDSWLSAELDDSAAPATMTLVARAAQMPAGLHSATVSISTAAPVPDRDTVFVELLVADAEPKPNLTLNLCLATD